MSTSRKEMLFCLRVVYVFLISNLTYAATTRENYFAYDKVEDQYGVIAPWYQGLNGQCDFRIRIAAETMKRYPWTTAQPDVVEIPAYMVNGLWSITDLGTITVRPITNNQKLNGDYGQRAGFVIFSLVDYYRYSGDPAAIAHITLMIDHMLNYSLTPSEHLWPNFPISVPIKGEGYHYYDPTSPIQLDIAAQEGLALLQAYQVTGESSWFDTAKHWGDLFATKRKQNPGPGQAPWDRYAVPGTGYGDRLTGGATIILQFLDELIRLGYTGTNNNIVEARDACREYIRDDLLPAWLLDETWGRHYWDWEHPVQGMMPTDSAVQSFMANPDYFTNWQADVRNIMNIFLVRTGADPGAMGDVYSGAWAYPESSNCCGTSLQYTPITMSSVYAQYGVLADDEWAREMARRQLIIATYDSHETGVAEDNILGGGIVAPDWFKAVHPWNLKYILDAIAWLPELFGPSRENHIMRSSSIVNSVIYGKGIIKYSTFDAPSNTVDVLRLAFNPTSITADGQSLSLRSDLNSNGYTVNKLSNGDHIISIRHDGKTSMVITGDDPQQVADDNTLTYSGTWSTSSSSYDYNGQVKTTRSNGATVIYNFNGNQTRLLGRVGPDGGLADVYIDGVKQLVGIDCWNPSLRYQQVLYYKNGLTNGPHELKIIAKGAKNAVAGGNNIYVDAVQYSAATGSTGFGEGGGPTKTQRMIFGYPKRQPFIDSTGNRWLPGAEYVARTGKDTDAISKTWWGDPAKGPVTNTNDPELYSYGIHAPEFWINVTVGPGEYYVRLKFAATRDFGCDNNAMTILINGRKIVSNMDIIQTAGGKNKAVDLVFNNISPSNGTIEIRFVGNIGKAFVQAIEVGQGNDGTGAVPVTLAAK